MRHSQPSSSRITSLSAVILTVFTAALIPGPTLGQDDLVHLSGSRVFPGNDGASASTLDRPLSELIDTWKKATGKKQFRKSIVIHKSRRRMDVFADDTILKSYIINLGLSPTGDKRKRGDMRTPEGDLFICTVNRQSQFTRFLGLSYPTPQSARAAKEAGMVSSRVVNDVRAAYKRRSHCPPQNTPLGGAVGIHGKGFWLRLPTGGYALADWTWGCVGLRDIDILELFNGYAEVGVPVRVDVD
jgi:hypothetical protein